ncbi:MAG: DUF87 domain-containing protein [Coriobacteriales bacterium]|nr:DUF87 domain-containing protein [Coriobacteriales bacterium]
MEWISDSQFSEPNIELDCLFDSGVTWGYRLNRDVEPVWQSPDDQCQHALIWGKTGKGKSNLLKFLVKQKIEQGCTVFVIDPHGDVAKFALNCVPEAYQDRVTYVDYSDISHLPTRNPLDVDVSDPNAVALAKQSFTALCTYEVYHEFTGPVWKHWNSVFLDVVFHPKYPFVRSPLSIYELAVNKDFRARAASYVGDNLAQELNRYEMQTHEREGMSLVNWIVAKYSPLSNSQSMKHVFSMQHATLDYAEELNKGRIIIVGMSQARLGRDDTRLIGTDCMQAIKRAVLQRSLGDMESQGNWYFFIDEFQSFASPDFAVMLAESRKYRASFTLANQCAHQLTTFNFATGYNDSSLLQAVLGNVGTMACFSMGANDARIVAEQFDIDISKVNSIPRYQALVRLLLNNNEMKPALVSVPLMETTGESAVAERVKQRMLDDGICIPVDGSLKTTDFRQKKAGSDTASAKTASANTASANATHAKTALMKILFSNDEQPVLRDERLKLLNMLTRICHEKHNQEDAPRLEAGDEVCHKKFGDGIVVEQTEKTMTIMFYEDGKTRRFAQASPHVSLLKKGPGHD